MHGMSYEQVMPLVKSEPLVALAGAETAKTCGFKHEDATYSLPSGATGAATRQSPQGEENVGCTCIVAAPMKEVLENSLLDGEEIGEEEQERFEEATVQTEAEVGDMCVAQGQGKQSLLAVAEARLAQETREELQVEDAPGKADTEIDIDRHLSNPARKQGHMGEQVEVQHPSEDAGAAQEEVDQVTLAAITIDCLGALDEPDKENEYPFPVDNSCSRSSDEPLVEMGLDPALETVPEQEQLRDSETLCLVPVDWIVEVKSVFGGEGAWGGEAIPVDTNDHQYITRAVSNCATPQVMVEQGRITIGHGPVVGSPPAKEAPSLQPAFSTVEPSGRHDNCGSHHAAADVSSEHPDSGVPGGKQREHATLLQDANCSTLELVKRVLGKAAAAPGCAEVFPGKAGVLTHQSFHTLCSVCKKEEGPDNTILCDKCDRSFHAECVQIDKEDATLLDEWLCPSCVVEGGSWRWQLTTKSLQLTTNLVHRATLQSDVRKENSRRQQVEPTTTRAANSGADASPEELELLRVSGTMQLRRRRRYNYSPTQLLPTENDQAQIEIAGCGDEDCSTGSPEFKDSPSMEGPDSSRLAGIQCAGIQGAGIGFTQSCLRQRHARALERLRIYIEARKGVLEEGWSAHSMKVKNNTALQSYYMSPSRKRFQSKIQVAQFLGCHTYTSTTTTQEDSCKELGDNAAQGDLNQIDGKPKVSRIGKRNGEPRTADEALEELREYISQMNGNLEEGWKAQIVPKKHDFGRMHICFISPSDTTLKTKWKVAEYLGLLNRQSVQKVPNFKLPEPPISFISTTGSGEVSQDAFRGDACNKPGEKETCGHVDQGREIESRGSSLRGDEDRSCLTPLESLQDVLLAGSDTLPQVNECATSTTELCHETPLGELVPPVDSACAKEIVSVGTETDRCLDVNAGYLEFGTERATGVAAASGGHNIFPPACEDHGGLDEIISGRAAEECSKTVCAIPVATEIVVVSTQIEMIRETPCVPTGIPGSFRGQPEGGGKDFLAEQNVGGVAETMVDSCIPRNIGVQAETHNEAFSKGDSTKCWIDGEVVGQRCPPVPSLAPVITGDAEKKMILQKIQAAKRQALLTDMFRPLKVPEALDSPKSDQNEVPAPDMSATRVASAPVLVEVALRTPTSSGDAVGVSTSVEQEKAVDADEYEWRIEPSMKVCFCTHLPFVNRAKAESNQRQGAIIGVPAAEPKMNASPSEPDKLRGKKKGAKVGELQQHLEPSKGAGNGKSTKTTKTAQVKVPKTTARKSKRIRTADNEEEAAEVLTPRFRTRSPEPQQVQKLGNKRTRRAESDQDPLLPSKRRSLAESDQLTKEAAVAVAVEVLKDPEACLTAGKRRGRPRKNTVQEQGDEVPAKHSAIPRTSEKRRGRPKMATAVSPYKRKCPPRHKSQRLLPEPSNPGRRYRELELPVRYQVPGAVKEEPLDYAEAEYVNRTPKPDGRHQQLETEYAVRASRGRHLSRSSEELEDMDDRAAFMAPESRSSREHGRRIDGEREYRSMNASTFSRGQRGGEQFRELHHTEFHSRSSKFRGKGVEEYPGQPTEDDDNPMTMYRGRAVRREHEKRRAEFGGKQSREHRTRNVEEGQELTTSQVLRHSRGHRGRHLEAQETAAVRAEFGGKHSQGQAQEHAPLVSGGNSSGSDRTLAPEMEDHMSRMSAASTEQLRAFKAGYGGGEPQ